MDFDLSRSQQIRLDLLRETIGRTPEEGVGLPGRHHEPTAEVLRGAPSLAGADVPFVDRILLVEEAARLDAAFAPTALLLIAPLGTTTPPSGPVAVIDRRDRCAVRDGAHARTVVDVSGAVPLVGPASPDRIVPQPSGMLVNYGSVAPSHLEPVAWDLQCSPRHVYRLGLAAEIAGAAHGAIAHVASYLVQRTAFGRPLSSLQALRHRLSERAVDAAGTSALVRLAAYSPDATSITAAVCHATGTAATLVPELHQLCGARGFLAEFGLSRRTMLLQALRLELGGPYDTAIEYAAHRWPA